MILNTKELNAMNKELKHNQNYEPKGCGQTIFQHKKPSHIE
jgi:hypothetical protein